MQEAILHIKEVGKRRDKQKTKNTFPTISRSDIMSGILSNELCDSEKHRLSRLYGEIIDMEKSDLRYINEIAISSESDLEIYEILRRLNKSKEMIK